MKKYLGALALLAVVSSTANALVLDEQLLGTPIAAGPGCPVGTTAVSVTSDHKAVEVLFSNYTVEADPKQYKTESKCLVTIPVTIPNGYEASLYRVDYESSFDLARKSEYQIERKYSLNGSIVNNPGKAVTALEVFSWDGHWYQITNTGFFSRSNWTRYNDGATTAYDRLQGSVNLQADNLILGTSNFVCNNTGKPAGVFLHADTKIRIYNSRANEPSYASIDRMTASKQKTLIRFAIGLRSCH